MKRTVVRLRNKRDYVKYHRMLWNGIVKNVENNKQDPLNTAKVKRLVFNELFDCRFHATPRNLCFGCEWATRDVNSPCCKSCLFTVKNTDSCNCFDGTFTKLVQTSNVEDFIVLAKTIRDWPVKRGND